jgi:hypothetical protein
METNYSGGPAGNQRGPAPVGLPSMDAVELVGALNQRGGANGMSLLRPQPTLLGSLFPSTNALPSFSSFIPYNPPRWIAVRQRFEQFHSNLALTPLQLMDGYTKRAGVISCLNRAYYGRNSDIDNSFFIGSWGKDTAIRPPRDVDVYAAARGLQSFSDLHLGTAIRAFTGGESPTRHHFPQHRRQRQ